MARRKKDDTRTPEERLTAALVPEDEQPYDVPENWCWTYLSQIADWGSGGTPSRKKPSYYKGNIPWIKTGELEDGYIYNSEEKITDEAIAHSSAKIFPAESVLIAMYGATIGKTAILGIPATTNQACACAQCKDGIYNKYLFYYLRSKKESFIEQGQGGAQPNISQDIIKKQPFALPPLAEQQRIVERIESLFSQLDEARDKVQEALDSFETRKAAILQAAFSGKLIQTEANDLVPLSEIAEEIHIGPFGSVLHKEDYVENGVPVINPKHIVNQMIIPDVTVAVSEEKVAELSSYRVKENDIILGRRGEMGRSAPITSEQEGWLCGTGSMIIRLKKGFEASFYSQIIASEPSVRFLEENAVGSTMSNLNEKIIRNLPIPNYTVREQKRMLEILSRLIETEKAAKDSIERVIENIDILKKSILAKAFREELGTNDLEDESAENLIKKITEEQMG